MILHTSVSLRHGREGRDYEDGRVTNSKGRALLWDNKSVETSKGHKVSLSQHQSQFEGYIARAKKKTEVLAFLVVAPEFSDDTAMTAMNLEVKWGCDVPVIRAGDLLWLAYQWRKRGQGKPIDLSFFKSSGLFYRAVLEQRLDLKDWIE